MTALSNAQQWIDEPANFRKKLVLCVGSVWILTDFSVSILQRVTDPEDKNVLGPFTYLSVKLCNRRRVAMNGPSTLLFGIPSNLQFSSTRGLARNMLGGYAIGIAFGMSTLSIFNSIYDAMAQHQHDPDSHALTASLMMNNISPWSLYVLNSCIFYTLEYLWAGVFQPNDLSVSSFMLYDHSNAFHIALCLSSVEYCVERVLFPELKILYHHKSKIHLSGLAMVIFGQLMRTLAQFTAGTNFNHQIQEYRKRDHVLIKHGVYKWLRHPSYFGFFYWSVGTQLLLGNPLSTVAYAAASWAFFADRIPYEEERLTEFFGDEYVQYKKTSFIGIPFIWT